MTHPLIQRLFNEFNYPEVTLETHESFIQQPGVTVLFFPGDPNRFRDTTDVAVVLPELVKAYNGTLVPGVIAADAGVALQQHYGFTAWPALVFVREGGYLGTLTGIQNWGDYLREINNLITMKPKPLPRFKVPVVGV